MRRNPGKIHRILIHHKVALLCAVFIGLLVACATFADIAAPHSPTKQYLIHTWAPPSSIYLLGTDGLGRDILSRLIFGTRISLAVATVASLFVLMIGVPLGLLSGYAGGVWDAMIMRVVDAMYAFPDILLVVVVSAVVKARLSGGVPWLLSPLTQVNDLLGGTLGIVLALGFTTWPVMCRLVRGQTLSIREFDFILAARSIGAKDFWILRRHVFPNIIGNVIAAITLVVPHAIMIEAGLSFLGLGVDPPTPSWGLIIAEGALAMRAHPHMLVSSTLLLSATVFALIVLGDWLHEMFDPTYLCPETV